MSSRTVVQSILTEEYGALGFKLTILNTLVNKKALKQADAHESEGDKVTVVVFNNSDLTNPI